MKFKEQQCPCAAVCATRGSSASILISYTTSAPCFFSSRCFTALALCFKAATASFRTAIKNNFCSQRHFKVRIKDKVRILTEDQLDVITMLSLYESIHNSNRVSNILSSYWHCWLFHLQNGEQNLLRLQLLLTIYLKGLVALHSKMKCNPIACNHATKQCKRDLALSTALSITFK